MSQETEQEENNRQTFIEEITNNQSAFERTSEVTPSEKSVFELDGTDFRPNEEALKLVVKNDAITSFLIERQYSPHCILVGPKGAGKSLLLRLRSWRFSKESDALNLSDGDGFSTKFDFSNSLNKRDLVTYVKDDDYRIVWEFSIKYFILRRLITKKINHPIYGMEVADIPGTEILDRIAPKYSRYLTKMGDVLSLLLQNRSVISDVSDCLVGLNGALQELEGVLDRPISLYIDNVDQAFLEKLVEGGGALNNIPLTKWAYNRKKEPIVKIWLNANIAFLRVVWNINKAFSNISLFATVRYEAWNHFLNSNLAKNIAQLESNIILLKYEKRELTQLIDNFISVQNKSLRKALRKIVDEKRLHPKVRDNQINGEKIKELMIRHTFGNPRDLIYLLSELRSEVIRIHKEKREDDVAHYGHLIDRVSNEKVFRNFAQECLPAFPFTELDDLLKKYKRNYFKRQELDDMEMLLIKELYRYGLIGVVDENQKLFFGRGSNYPEEKITLPDSPIYFTHPCLDYELSKISKNGDFYYPYCIIGNGLPFKSKNAKTYYLPKLRPVKYDKAIEDKFTAFYDSEFAIEEFSKIPIRIKTKYASLFLLYMTERKNGFNESLQDSIKRGIGSCMRKEEDLKLLSRNIKLRIILALATLFKMYTEGWEIISLFEESRNVKDISYFITTTTFTHDCYTAARAINTTKVLKSLSDFEATVIYDFLRSEKIDKYLSAEEDPSGKMKEKITHAKAIFSLHFPLMRF